MHLAVLVSQGIEQGQINAAVSSALLRLKKVLASRCLTQRDICRPMAAQRRPALWPAMRLEINVLTFLLFKKDRPNVHSHQRLRGL